MEWKTIAIVSGLSLAFATGGGGLLAKSALANADPTPTPTIITPTDVSLAASVQATLANDRDLSDANIAVSAKDGFVYLLGSVRSDSERGRAVMDAKSIPGVTRVEESLSLVQSDI